MRQLFRPRPPPQRHHPATSAIRVRAPEVGRGAAEEAWGAVEKGA